jgi:hypothetical protein
MNVNNLVLMAGEADGASTGCSRVWCRGSAALRGLKQPILPRCSGQCRIRTGIFPGSGPAFCYRVCPLHRAARLVPLVWQRVLPHWRTAPRLQATSLKPAR